MGQDYITAISWHAKGPWFNKMANEDKGFSSSGLGFQGTYSTL
jgi:hypothetical protein